MSAPTYPCAICGRWKRADRMIYSRHTGQRFCRLHILKPEPRRKRQAVTA